MGDDASGSGASDCIPIQAGTLKKGSHVVLKGFPCKIVDYSCVLSRLVIRCFCVWAACAWRLPVLPMWLSSADGRSVALSMRVP